MTVMHKRTCSDVSQSTARPRQTDRHRGFSHICGLGPSCPFDWFVRGGKGLLDTPTEVVQRVRTEERGQCYGFVLSLEDQGSRLLLLRESNKDCDHFVRMGVSHAFAPGYRHYIHHKCAAEQKLSMTRPQSHKIALFAFFYFRASRRRQGHRPSIPSCARWQCCDDHITRSTRLRATVRTLTSPFVSTNSEFNFEPHKARARHASTPALASTQTEQLRSSKEACRVGLAPYSSPFLRTHAPLRSS
jgi:hypothetical protein